MVTSKQKNSHIWERETNDWYVEPSACSLALFDNVDFSGGIWDPACGSCRIVRSAEHYSLESVGTDKVSRANKCVAEIDFLDTTETPHGIENIVTNPPFGIAEDFVLHSLKILPDGGKAAFLLPLVWMAGFSTKRHWLPTSPLIQILPISPRPSMPPGEVLLKGEKPGNGTKDFGWFVWQVGSDMQPTLVFLNTSGYKTLGSALDAELGEHECEHRIAELL